MKQIWNDAVPFLSAGRRFVLATVASATGSTPCAVGAVMLVTEDGASLGTVGGGSIEAQAREEALELFAAGGWRKREFRLDNAAAAAAGMVCGGSAVIFLTLVTDSDLPAFLAVRDRVGANGRGSLSFRLEGSGRSVAFAERMAAADHDANTVAVPVSGGGPVYIFGGGHVGFETARIANLVDFATVVLDDREEFASAERFPDAQIVKLDNFDRARLDLPVDDNSYLVIVTRGHRHDATILDFALRSGAAYIGMIGSRKKRDITYGMMREIGHSQGSLARVHSPIGLNIGAKTPAEVGVAIVGELIQARAEKEAAKTQAAHPPPRTMAVTLS